MNSPPSRLAPTTTLRPGTEEEGPVLIPGMGTCMASGLEGVVVVSVVVVEGWMVTSTPAMVVVPTSPSLA